MARQAYWIRRMQTDRFPSGHVIMVRETIGGDLPDYDARERTTVYVAAEFPGWPNETRVQAQDYATAYFFDVPNIADPVAKPDACPTCEGFGNADGRTPCTACFGTGSARFAAASARYHFDPSVCRNTLAGTLPVKTPPNRAQRRDAKRKQS